MRGMVKQMNRVAEAAKDLRHSQTEAEKRLWERLKTKHLSGAKFRRQEPIGSFIVDFVSYENKLIIEIDGSPHRNTETKIHDGQKTAWLQAEGFRVMRLWNSDIFGNLERVIKKIRLALSRSTPHSDSLPQGARAIVKLQR